MLLGSFTSFPGSALVDLHIFDDPIRLVRMVKSMVGYPTRLTQPRPPRARHVGERDGPRRRTCAAIRTSRMGTRQCKGAVLAHHLGPIRARRMGTGVTCVEQRGLRLGTHFPEALPSSPRSIRSDRRIEVPTHAARHRHAFGGPTTTHGRSGAVDIQSVVVRLTVYVRLIQSGVVLAAGEPLPGPDHWQFGG